MIAIDGLPYDEILREIELYPRLCGYYVSGFVQLDELRQRSAAQDEIVDLIYRHFDEDQKTVGPGYFPADHSWDEYEVSQGKARTHTVEALVGGRSIGHLVDAMPRSVAEDLFDRFVESCGANPRFYIGLGIGDRRYTFLHGALVVADKIAGLLWIVESD